MIRKLVLASLMTLTAGSAFATGTSWDFGTTQPEYKAGNSLHVNAGGVNLTVTAWASTADACVGGYGNGTMSDPDPCIEKANLRVYGGGLGIINVDEQNFKYGDQDNQGNNLKNSEKPSDYWGQHAIDSKQNRGDDAGAHDPDLDFEMVLLSFDHSVSITALSKSWPNNNDSDFSALAYTDSSPFSSFEGSTWEDLAAGGAWDVVDNGTMRNTGSISSNTGSTTAIGSGTQLFSQFWLVGAYNSVFGGHLSEGDDVFKLNGLKTVKYTPPTGGTDINAPATAGMFLAFVGLMLMRKKQTKG